VPPRAVRAPAPRTRAYTVRHRRRASGGGHRVSWLRMPHALAIAMAAAVAAAPGPFELAPTPAWVEPVAIDARGAEQGQADAGVELVLVDEQVRAAGTAPERYRRVVRRLRTVQGVQDGSEIRVDFDPAYERLALHGVWIHRGGRRLPALRADEVRIVQRERELDRRLFDGTLTAVVFLQDVRAGDAIEFAYTIRGANPVFAGRFAHAFDLAYTSPAGRIRARLLWPEGRPLQVKVHGMDLAPRLARAGGLVERVWERAAVPAVAPEGDLPEGFDPFPWVELSEWPSWSAVAEWAAALYAAAPRSAALARQVAAWERLPTEEARARAALRFVQDEVRYLGMEMGPSSHRPHPPGEVFARRFGDCKDKSFLLVTALRALGVEAAPALASTRLRAAVDERLPSPFAFDHVIVHARVDGVERWLEPTRSLEHGRIADVPPPAYRRALIVRPGTRGLVAIPDPAPGELDVLNRYRVERFGGPVQLEVTTHLTGRRAVAMRHTLASQPLADLQKDYLGYYAHAHPRIRVAAPLRVADAPDADDLTLVETYELPPFSADEERDFLATAIDPELRDPSTPLRKMPLGVDHPVRIHEAVRIELPGPPDLRASEGVVATPAARLARTIGVKGRAIAIDWTYATLRERLEPAAVPDHLASLRRMRDLAGVGIPLAVLAPRPSAREGGGGWGWLLGTIAGVVLAAALVLRAAEGGLRRDLRNLRLWRRRRAFASKFRMVPGETPEAPLPIQRPEDAARHVARRRCACGGRLVPEPAAREVVRYGGGEVGVARHACARCGAAVNLYFTRAG